MHLLANPETPRSAFGFQRCRTSTIFHAKALHANLLIHIVRKHVAIPSDLQIGVVAARQELLLRMVSSVNLLCRSQVHLAAKDDDGPMAFPALTPSFCVR